MSIFTGRLPPLFIAVQIATVLALVLAGLLLATSFTAPQPDTAPMNERLNGE